MLSDILNIEESNRMIANFMEVKCKFVDISHLNEPSFYMITLETCPSGYWNPNVPKTKNDCFHHFIQYAEYHTNWQWLMPVVEKIESIHSEHHGYFGVHISSNGCTIQGTNIHFALEDLEGYGWVYMSDPNAILDTKLESTYYNVVKFIEWYTTEYNGE
jgi:hypothetical protein